MNDYVVGFAFNENRDSVVLIRKAKPADQAGLLNGVGGKIEDAEDRPVQTMVREFREETGVHTQEIDWKQFHLAMYRDETGMPKCNVYFFKLFDDEVYAMARTKEKEPVEKHLVRQILGNPEEFMPMPNLAWLLPLALDTRVNRSYTTDWDGTAIQPLKRLPKIQDRHGVREHA